jgi:hypothetical protein
MAAPVSVSVTRPATVTPWPNAALVIKNTIRIVVVINFDTIPPRCLGS